jgi:transposase
MNRVSTKCFPSRSSGTGIKAQGSCAVVSEWQVVAGVGGARVEVSRMSVSRWYRAWKKSGKQALRAAPRAGRKPLVSVRHLQKVQSALRQGARAHGFSADLWTLPRVATVIERVIGVRYHPGHVWKMLGAMQWSVQKPERQARERDAEQVEYWKTTRWPELKKRLLADTKRRWLRPSAFAGMAVERACSPGHGPPVLTAKASSLSSNNSSILFMPLR